MTPGVISQKRNFNSIEDLKSKPIHVEGGFKMARKPLPVKPWHLYDLIPYMRAKSSRSYEKPFPFTTYGKTKNDAMKTFKDNHTGDFILISDSKEIQVTICADGIWFERSVALA